MRFGATVAVDDVDLAVPPGRWWPCSGPSGCGKSTLLRTVAGLEDPTAGPVLLRRARPRRRTHPPAGLRADVPGRPALRAPRRRRATSPTRCGCATAAGAEQRARVGRAARARRAARGTPTGCPPPSPAASASGSRWPGRWPSSRGCCCSTSRSAPSTAGCASVWPHELHDILRVAGATAMLVTHDQEEAFAVADRMAVMREGRIVQQGTLDEVWRHPADDWAAEFLGYADRARRRPGPAAARAGRPGRDVGGGGAAPLRAAGRPGGDAARPRSQEARVTPEQIRVAARRRRASARCPGSPTPAADVRRRGAGAGGPGHVPDRRRAREPVARRP